MERYITYPSQELIIKDIDSGARTIVQAFAKYDSVDSDNDITRKGFYTRSWNNNKSRIKHLLNHDIIKPVGKPEQLFDDGQYAMMKSKIGTHKLGDDFLEMADSGLITEASYGAIVVKSNRLKDGKREIVESKIFEISSLTHWGSQGDTPLVSVRKSLFDAPNFEQKALERLAAVEKFCRNSNASDETIELLLLENKQLTELILTLKATKPAHQAPSPDLRMFSSAIQTFTNSLKI